jgi:tRNA (guanine-N7-)-methyltransferase
MARRRKLNRFKLVAPAPEIVRKYILPYPPKLLYHCPESLALISSVEIFGNSQPLILDLGCGRGEFIISQAQASPHKNFIGIDIHWKSLFDAANKIRAHPLDNVRFIRSDLRWVLQRAPDSSIETIFLLFPPPITRKKFLKREVLTEDLIRQCHRILKTGGLFHFVTDIESYFQRKVSLIERLDPFCLVSRRESFEGGLTWYQEIWEGHGLPSLRAIYVKSSEVI